MSATNTSANPAQVVHDLVLSVAPAGFKHECELCTKEGPPSVDTVTKDQIDAAVATAVAAAVAERDNRIADLERQLSEDKAAKATEEAVEAARTAMQAELDKARQDLDVATARATAAEGQVKQLEDAAALQAEAEQASAQEQGRVDQVLAVAKFDEAHVAARRERWGRMPEDDFDAFVDSLKAAVGPGGPNPGPPEKRPGLTTTATHESGKSAAAEVIALRRTGVDVRTA